MVPFRQKLWSEYPIPQNLSIWGGDNITTYPIEDVEQLISSVVEEVASDVLITEYMEASGMITYMPSNCVVVASAKLSGAFPFQGNRQVKWTYDKSSNKLYLRYFPASVTYRRHLTLEDLDSLQGDRLNYVLAKTLEKMAQKELIYLRSVNMSVDNATVDLTYLQTFASENKNTAKELKEQLLPYVSVV